MAERAVHEAAVEAGTKRVMEEWALFRNPRSGGTELVPSEYEEVVWSALAALVASAEVREGLVAALYAKEGRWYEAEGAHRPDGTPIPGLRLWPLVDVVLAALAGTEAA